MDKQEAIEAAARELLAHGGPDCLTDPRQVRDAMRLAADAGATHDEITAEMRRQRGAA
ncbi:hypothetical protein [Streptomyces sp. NPDC058045]|uniref:hypothetical protein n=1 Tax=Streptomyces sp. NPDC058045 TaxID=3346311 RepID=UPI0036E22BE8